MSLEVISTSSKNNMYAFLAFLGQGIFATFWSLTKAIPDLSGIYDDNKQRSNIWKNPNQSFLSYSYAGLYDKKEW